MKKINVKFIFLSTSLFLFSCENNVKFQKSHWNQKGDPDGYPNRESMLKDLTENHKLKGLTYTQLIDSIGLPENYSDEKSNTLTYNIITDYGHDIDPVYLKNLEIKLSKDSIVEDYKIVEIKN